MKTIKHWVREMMVYAIAAGVPLLILYAIIKNQ